MLLQALPQQAPVLAAEAGKEKVEIAVGPQPPAFLAPSASRGPQQQCTPPGLKCVCVFVILPVSLPPSFHPSSYASLLPFLPFQPRFSPFLAHLLAPSLPHPHRLPLSLSPTHTHTHTHTPHTLDFHHDRIRSSTRLSYLSHQRKKRKTQLWAPRHLHHHR